MYRAVAFYIRCMREEHSGALLKDGSRRRRDRLPRVLLGLALLAFIVFKWSYLNLPFYWDEAWVYAPAVKAMHQHGPSLLPDAIPPDLSRGHPLLFHALAAAWMWAFGASFTSMHLFPLLVTALLAWGLFRFAAAAGNDYLGLAAALLLLANEIVLAQSGLLLPETLLALFCVLAMRSLLLRQRLRYMLWMSCALLTKETALACLCAAVVFQLMRCREAPPTNRRDEGMFTLIAAGPVLLLALFLLIQRLELGWMLYPEHTGLMTWGAKDIVYKAKRIFEAVFENQGMVVLTYAVGMAAPLLNSRIQWGLRLLIGLLFVTLVKVLFGRWTLPYGPIIGVCLGCLLALFILYFDRMRRTDGRIGEVAMLSFLCCIALWSFSALNFYTDRYLLVIIPFIAAGGAAVLESTFARWHRQAATGIMLACAALVATRIGADGRVGDSRLSYKDAIAVHMGMARLCEDLGLYDVPIHGSFMDIDYLSTPSSGYLSSGRAFSAVTNGIGPSTRYAIADYSRHAELPDELEAAGFHEVGRIQQGPAWSALYKRRVP